MTYESAIKWVEESTLDENGHYDCPACKTYGYYDKEKYDRQKDITPPMYVI